MRPGFCALPDGEWLHRIGAALELPGFEAGWDARAVSRRLAEEVPAFEGRDVDSVGLEGRPL